MIPTMIGKPPCMVASLEALVVPPVCCLLCSLILLTQGQMHAWLSVNGVPPSQNIILFRDARYIEILDAYVRSDPPPLVSARFQTEVFTCMQCHCSARGCKHLQQSLAHRAFCVISCQNPQMSDRNWFSRTAVFSFSNPSR